MTVTPMGAASGAATQRNGMFGPDGAQFDMFLKLLTTQMQNQDPLDPMETGEYTQQLAQYSQVEQAIQQTGLLQQLLAQRTAGDLADASGLIGRTVEFDSSVAALGQTPALWRWTLPRDAAGMTAEIRDSGGRLVATPPVTGAGTTGELSWDGRLADGSRAPNGAYVLKLTAKDAGGAAVAVTLRSVGTVGEVVQRDGELWLGIGGEVALPIGELVRVTSSS